MRIAIPHSSHPITRVNVSTPQGSISGDFTQEHKFYDVDLPEGVTEDEVGVGVEYLTNGYQVVEGQTIKYAIEKPIDPPTVDPPADETVTDEQIDKAITDDCECGEKEACSNCDPEDEIAEPKDETSDA